MCRARCLTVFVQVEMKSSRYPEGQGDLVSRLIRGISRVTIWVFGVISLVTKSP